MKKTLAALAVMGAFGATSAFAADVTLYGLVDYGFNYQHIDGDQPGVDAADNFKMMSGQNSGSRFGLKGTEDLGNGLKVIFQLENGFNGDDGTFNTDGKLFDRQATLARPRRLPASTPLLSIRSAIPATMMKPAPPRFPGMKARPLPIATTPSAPPTRRRTSTSSVLLIPSTTAPSRPTLSMVRRTRILMTPLPLLSAATTTSAS